MSIVFQSWGRFVLSAVLVSTLLMPGAPVLGQVEPPTAAAPASDAEMKLQWLKSHTPPKAPAAPKVVAPPKIGFRTNPQVIAPRAVEIAPEESRPTPPAPAGLRAAESLPAKPASTEPAKVRSVENRPAKATPAPVAKLTPAAVRPPVSSAQSRSVKATPAPLAKLTTPTAAPKAPPVTRTTVPRSTPTPKSTSTVAALPSPKTTPAKTAPISTAKGRYPWKTGIVTTVFWIGEKPAGNNFTPNRSSSWDAHWMQNFGGFDNPDPAARRNFIPVKFTPRQNPFYVALPYNDVTRGTTKPEARRVIPWFKEAFREEGQSVCRDRWVAVRSRSGKIAYAQWSDCGPFRTDHWQYVFGSEKPKPNLNQGAGLDVSPAVRDCLGIDTTDVTDWKFVDCKDVPSGPWARYGSNNTFASKDARPSRTGVKENVRTAEASSRARLREL